MAPARACCAAIVALMLEAATAVVTQNERVSTFLGRRGPQKLNVAYCVFVTDVSDPAWKDALAVLSFGIRKAAARSRHDAELIALAPERMTKQSEDFLLQNGFAKVVKKPVPIPSSLIENTQARKEMEHVQGGDNNHFALEEETIKYWGMALMDYDKVLVLDADTMVLDPMDELFERDEDLVGVYDHGLDCCGSAMPPVQGGFLLFRPSIDDFEAVKGLTKEGDWRGGAGWKGTHVGYWYGGVGPDGLLQYYYNKGFLESPHHVGKQFLPEGIAQPKLSGSRMLAADRTVYDVLTTKRLMKELEGTDHAQALANVKSVHFTGECIKPWTCFEPRKSEWLCQGLISKWWALRAELAKTRAKGDASISASDRCQGGRYTPLPEP